MHQHFRYAFRSTEKVALQEIGPRFTLKLRWLRKGLPAVRSLGEPSKTLEFDTFEQPEEKEDAKIADGEQTEAIGSEISQKPVQLPKDEEYQWMWKVLELCLLYQSFWLTMNF